MRGTLRRAITAAPIVVAAGLIAGNVGLLVKHGLHPNLETAVGFLWIAADYALRQKERHPVTAPRLNAAGIILGSLLLSASGIHAQWIDWRRVRTPLGYIPSSLTVGLQKELRSAGTKLASSTHLLTRACGAVARHPYTLAAAINAYGVIELAGSALAVHDRGLLWISAAYGVATLALPFMDGGRNTA